MPVFCPYRVHLGVPPYVVFGDKTLREMATSYPQTEDEFLVLNGIGQQKLAQFGELFLSVIQKYVESNDIQTTFIRRNLAVSPPCRAVSPPSSSSAVKKPKHTFEGTTYDETKKFLKQKIPIKAIAEIRGITEGTIVSHMEKIISEDKSFDISYLQPEKKRFDIIAKAFKKANTYALTPVKEILGDAYTYDELRLARVFLNKN